jgi:uncharacterized paraquat-inducible protein A
MVISSRTPEGRTNRCPVCGSHIVIEPSDPARDAPCPACGHLIWFNWDERGDEQVIRLTATRLLPEAVDATFDTAAELTDLRVVIDFSEVQEASSAALAKLITLKKKLGFKKRKLILRHLRQNPVEVFRITRLDQVFQIES